MLIMFIRRRKKKKEVVTLLAGFPRANFGNLKHHAATRVSHLLNLLTLTNWLFLFLFPQEVNFPRNCDSWNSSHCCGSQHMPTLLQISCYRSKLPVLACAIGTSLAISRAVLLHSQHYLYWSRMTSPQDEQYQNSFGHTHTQIPPFTFSYLSTY